MVMNLLIGLPGDRPGGLVLTLIFFFASGAGALMAGFVYAAVCVALPRTSLIFQAAGALLRGIPLILLVYLLAHVSLFSIRGAGLLALTLYSFSHVGEILRSFLAAYPRPTADQARLMGMSSSREWLESAGSVDSLAVMDGAAHPLDIAAQGHGRLGGPGHRRIDDNCEVAFRGFTELPPMGHHPDRSGFAVSRRDPGFDQVHALGGRKAAQDPPTKARGDAASRRTFCVNCEWEE